MLNIRKFFNGLKIVPKTSSGVSAQGEMDVTSGNGKINYHNGTTSSPIVTEAHSATLTNKVLSGNTASSLINGSGTLNTNSTGTITIPNATDTLVGKATTDTLTNKILSGNTATNLINGSGTTNFNSTGTITLPNATDTLVGKATTDTLSNKTLDNSTALTIKDVNLTIQDDGDITKQIKFQLSGITTGNTRTLTVPDASTTIVGTDATQTLTNKTLSGNIASNFVNSGTITFPTTTDTLVGRATTDTLTNKTLTAPVIATIVNTGTLTLPSSTDTLVGRATTDTLTNKTLTAPVISSIVNSGTLTLPTSTDTLVGRATTDTLTNKTFGDAITLTQISTPSNPASGKDKIYTKNDNNLYILTSGGVETVFSSTALIRSTVWVQTGNGYGAVSTAIRRFSTISKNTGTAISYADTANLGGTFTINEDGVYSISYADAASASGNNFGISLNSTHLTSSIQTLSPPENQGHQNNTSSSTSQANTIVVTTILSAGDIIRAHGEIGALMNSSVTGITNFRITKVNN